MEQREEYHPLLALHSRWCGFFCICRQNVPLDSSHTVAKLGMCECVLVVYYATHEGVFTVVMEIQVILSAAVKPQKSHKIKKEQTIYWWSSGVKSLKPKINIQSLSWGRSSCKSLGRQKYSLLFKKMICLLDIDSFSGQKKKCLSADKTKTKPRMPWCLLPNRAQTPKTPNPTFPTMLQRLIAFLIRSSMP